MRIGVGVPRQERASGVGALVEFLASEGLLTSSADGRQTQRLATSWNWDESSTVLKMTLRRDVFFHDGTRLTPELAAQSLRNSITNHEAFSFSSVTDVSVAGEDAIQLKLMAPDSFLVPDLALTSLRMPGRPQVGAGPFQVVRADSERTVLKAFDRYYRGRPAIDQIEVTKYSTQRKAWAAMMRGDLDMLYEVSRDAVEFLENESAVDMYSFPRSYYIPLVFNVRHPILQRADIRRALNEAIDKQTLVAQGLRGRGRPAVGPIWPEHWANSTVAHPYAFNPDAARLRLDNAGLKVRTGRGTMPARFSFTCLVFADDARFERLALLVQKQLWDIGVDMRLQPVTASELAARAGSGQFDAFLFEMAGRSLSWVYRFWHSPDGPALIDTGYRSADAILDSLRHARSDDEIRSGVADLARVLTNDPPAVFLAWQSQYRAVSTAFDVAAEPNRDFLFGTPWLWRRAPADVRAQR
jgi:peptide/nickel transport system substrate-binding protein